MTLAVAMLIFSLSAYAGHLATLAGVERYYRAQVARFE